MNFIITIALLLAFSTIPVAADSTTQLNDSAMGHRTLPRHRRLLMIGSQTTSNVVRALRNLTPAISLLDEHVVEMGDSSFSYSLSYSVKSAHVITSILPKVPAAIFVSMLSNVTVPVTINVSTATTATMETEPEPGSYDAMVQPVSATAFESSSKETADTKSTSYSSLTMVAAASMIVVAVAVMFTVRRQKMTRRGTDRLSDTMVVSEISAHDHDLNPQDGSSA
jgi:hypothetical protein